VLAARWLEQPPTFGARLRLSTASISTLDWEREVPVILTWNDTTHLRNLRKG
jgi:broad specificity phosphatase PhoE